MEALAKTLNERNNDIQFKPYLGLKHIDPFIEDAVKQMREDHIEEALRLYWRHIIQRLA